MILHTSNIYEQLKQKYLDQDFVNGTVEILGCTFLADSPTILPNRAPNHNYISREIQWYHSQSTNIYDIQGNTPKAWVSSAGPTGEINSNYGKLIFSDEYHNQYSNTLRELKRNPDSRRACMIYNRPSMWHEYCELGKNDFVCTFAVTYHIRDDKLHAHVCMRSNDAVFGYVNDLAWQKHVLYKLSGELNVPAGDIIWTASSMHVYERHFRYFEDE